MEIKRIIELSRKDEVFGDGVSHEEIIELLQISEQLHTGSTFYPPVVCNRLTVGVRLAPFNKRLVSIVFEEKDLRKVPEYCNIFYMLRKLNGIK